MDKIFSDPDLHEDADDLAFADLLKEHDTPFDHAITEMARQRAQLLATGKGVRRARGLTQKQVAELMDTKQSVVSDLESGRVDPRLRTLLRYGHAIQAPFHSSFGSLETSDYLAARALAPILTKLIREADDRQARTLAALKEALRPVPPDWTERMLKSLHGQGWAKSSIENGDQVFSLQPGAVHLIGVSIHRDRIVGVLTEMSVPNEDDSLLEMTKSLPENSPAEVITAVVDVVRRLYRARDSFVLGVGVSIAGVVDKNNGKVQFSPTLRSEDQDWEGVDLETLLQDRIRAEVDPQMFVVVENDVNALAVWDYMRGGEESVAVLLLSGVGIGASLIVDGRVSAGAHSAAGEIGHTIVDPEGPPCRVGLDHRGCLETVASAEGILAKLELPRDNFGALAKGLDVANERVIRGDAEAIEAIAQAGRALGSLLLSTTLLLDPSLNTVYAHSHLAQPERYESARVFQAGIAETLAVLPSQRFRGVGEPNLRWHSLKRTSRAVAASQAALWHFVQDPTRCAPATMSSLTVLALVS